MTKHEHKKTQKDNVATLLSTEKSKKTIMADNSFAFCITNITGIPSEIFNDIKFITNNFEDDWYRGYVDVLRDHSYDMIFFTFKNSSLLVNDKTSIRDWVFNNIPQGKCIVLGKNDNEFRCIVGITGSDSKLIITYDPDPKAKFDEILGLAFFINTFVTVSDETEELFVVDDGENLESKIGQEIP